MRQLDEPLTISGVGSFELLRSSSTRVYHNRSQRLIARVLPGCYRDTDEVNCHLNQVVAVAEAGGPVVAPVDTKCRELDDGSLVTIWPMFEQVSGEITAQDLACLTAGLHNVNVDVALTVHEPSADQQTLLEQTVQATVAAEKVGIDRSLVEFVVEAAVNTTAAVQRLWDITTARYVVSHRDIHAGNAVSDSGRLLLIDLDLLCLSKPEVDWACVAFENKRGIEPSRQQHPLDLPDHLNGALLDALVKHREFACCLWQLRMSEKDPVCAAEFVRRVTNFNDPLTSWTTNP